MYACIFNFRLAPLMAKMEELRESGAVMTSSSDGESLFVFFQVYMIIIIGILKKYLRGIITHVNNNDNNVKE